MYWNFPTNVASVSGESSHFRRHLGESISHRHRLLLAKPKSSSFALDFVRDGRHTLRECLYAGRKDSARSVEGDQPARQPASFSPSARWAREFAEFLFVELPGHS